MSTLSDFLDQLVIGKPELFRGLVVFPVHLVSNAFERSREDIAIVGNGRHNPNIHIFETGHMDRVRVHNMCKSRLLLMNGATIRGGAGNRVVVSSAVLENEEEVEIPVRSVEERRWECVSTPTGTIFIKAENPKFNRSAFAIGSLKRAILTESLPHLSSDKELRIDQSHVWSMVSDMFRKRGIKADNLDMHTLYSHSCYILDLYADNFHINERQIGFITFLSKKNWFIDIFLNNGMLKKAFPSQIVSYAFDVLDWEKREKAMSAARNVPTADDATDIIAHIKTKKLSQYNVLGRDSGAHYMNTNLTCGTALIKEDKLFYLSCCSKAQTE